MEVRAAKGMPARVGVQRSGAYRPGGWGLCVHPCIRDGTHGVCAAPAQLMKVWMGRPKAFTSSCTPTRMPRNPHSRHSLAGGQEHISGLDSRPPLPLHCD